MPFRNRVVTGPLDRVRHTVLASSRLSEEFQAPSLFMFCSIIFDRIEFEMGKGTPLFNLNDFIEDRGQRLSGQTAQKVGISVFGEIYLYILHPRMTRAYNFLNCSP